jgi:hypothetical protein
LGQTTSHGGLKNQRDKKNNLRHGGSSVELTDGDSLWATTRPSQIVIGPSIGAQDSSGFHDIRGQRICLQLLAA